MPALEILASIIWVQESSTMFPIGISVDVGSNVCVVWGGIFVNPTVGAVVTRLCGAHAVSRIIMISKKRENFFIASPYCHQKSIGETTSIYGMMVTSCIVIPSEINLIAQFASNTNLAPSTQSQLA